VGTLRCDVCQSALRTYDDEPVVYLRITDVEQIACVLHDYVNMPDIWGDVVQRLEQACGRTVAQINATHGKPHP
jgi:hypothetical protein